MGSTELEVQSTLRVGRALDRLLEPLEPVANGHGGTPAAAVVAAGAAAAPAAVPRRARAARPTGSQRDTAQRILTRGQAVAFGLAAAIVAAGLGIDTRRTVIGLIAAAMAFWVLFVGFRVVVWVASGLYRFPTAALPALTDESLPRYTIFVPLHREGRVVAKLVEAINRLSYPKELLQVLLLLEADDEETWTAIRDLSLGAHFTTVEIPPGGPKTKPNALNFGLARATGELCVIYDAEDRPEQDQLLKAVACFRDSPEEVVCVQARLAFWNGTSSWVTRFYWAEYVAHFEWGLTGAAKLGLVPPLGGTSNHFITARLRDVAIDPQLLPFEQGYVGGWDPYNVTEDAELAAALARKGYRIAMLDSTTWEEATARLSHADKQRRRWLKGYAQTGLVYTRSPLATGRQMGYARWFFFNLIMLGTPFSLLLTPFFWGLTLAYFVTRSPTIESLFPPPLYYVGIFVMVLGNLALFHQLVATCLKRGAYGSVKFMLCSPIWWLFTSWSAYAMVIELILRPHHWHKTQHGHDLDREELQLAIETR